MAYEIPNFYVGVFPADVDLSSKQYYGATIITPVSVQGTGQGLGAAAVLPGSNSTPAIGVLQNAPVQAEAAQIMVQGVTKAILGATVQVGNFLYCETDGTFKPTTSGKYAMAIALETGVTGDIAAILLQRNGKQ